MVGLCESGNEPPGSLKASKKQSMGVKSSKQGEYSVLPLRPIHLFCRWPLRQALTSHGPFRSIHRSRKITSRWILTRRVAFRLYTPCLESVALVDAFGWRRREANERDLVVWDCCGSIGWLPLRVVIIVIHSDGGRSGSYRHSQGHGHNGDGCYDDLAGGRCESL
ncbi:hypothetical protein ANN_19298 [Periplaneta americana]|uniref:Uncharacterized protein n=1 Tax=Periplaneta americana TaxID=6978 RepID=A0ABQ8S9H2_PERAM|nr:hypothetical protein ANN_19298 [Periplaneta americana]